MNLQDGNGRIILNRKSRVWVLSRVELPGSMLISILKSGLDEKQSFHVDRTARQVPTLRRVEVSIVWRDQYVDALALADLMNR